MKNLDLEKKILSMLLLNNDLFLATDLEETDFSSEQHKNLFLLAKKYKSNVEQMAWKLKDEAKDYLYEVFATAFSTQSFAEDVAELKELTELRRIHWIAKSIQFAIADGADLWRIQDKILELEQEKAEKADMSQVLQEIVEETTGIREIVKYDCWFPKLDTLLWGFRPWQLVIVWARPSVGKTMWALNLMLNQVESWIKSAFFSLEMDNKSITQRILAINSAIPMRALLGVMNSEQLTKLNASIEKFNTQLKSLILIDNAFKISEIVRQITYLHKKEGLQIAYIDYLWLIRGQGQNRNLEIWNITRELKLLAMELWIPIILLAQLNRESEKRAIKEPILADLRDSWNIEQDADTVIMLHRELMDTPNLMTVFVKKNRNWPVGEIEFDCEPASMQIAEKDNPF